MFKELFTCGLGLACGFAIHTVIKQDLPKKSNNYSISFDSNESRTVHNTKKTKAKTSELVLTKNVQPTPAAAPIKTVKNLQIAQAQGQKPKQSPRQITQAKKNIFWEEHATDHRS